MTDREVTSLPLRDEPAINDLAWEMVDAFNAAINRVSPAPDKSLENPAIRMIQYEAMKSVLEIVQCQDMLAVRNSGFYRGLSAGKHISRNKYDREFDAMLNLITLWRGRAKGAEGKLRKLEREDIPRHATEQAKDEPKCRYCAAPDRPTISAHIGLNVKDAYGDVIVRAHKFTP